MSYEGRNEENGGNGLGEEHCSLLSIVVINTKTKDNLGRNRIISF